MATAFARQFVILIGFSDKVRCVCHPRLACKERDERRADTASCAQCHLIFAKISHTYDSKLALALALNCWKEKTKNSALRWICTNDYSISYELRAMNGQGSVLSIVSRDYVYRIKSWIKGELNDTQWRAIFFFRQQTPFTTKALTIGMFRTTRHLNGLKQ